MVSDRPQPSEIFERAINACVVRNLPDVRLNFVHIKKSWEKGVSDEDFGAALHARSETRENTAAPIRQPKAGWQEAAIQI